MGGKDDFYRRQPGKGKGGFQGKIRHQGRSFGSSSLG